LLFAAFSLFALATPARAGHWVLTTKGSGQAMVGSGGGMIQTFTPPPPSTNSVTINQIGSGFGIGPSFGWPPDTVTASANLQVTVTGTWTSDSNSDNTAPPGVWLSESSTASATCTNAGVMQAGSADDGWGDPVAQSGSQMGTSAPPSGQKYVKQSGGSFTASLTLSASASGKQGMYQGGYGASVSLGPITIAVHAQPYGWYDAGWDEPNGTHHVGGHSDNSTGELGFNYGWKSTDGNLADLKGITMYEYVSYSGPGTFNSDKTTFYPGAPVQSGYSIPNGRAGSPIDPTTLYARDVHSPFTTTSPLVAATWTAAQKYEFDDPATGEVGVILYDAGNITDAVQLNPNQFYISKSGYSATKPL